jgi:hypothetical protein
MLMFIIVAGALYLRFRGAHNVPGHVSLTSSRWAASGTAGTVNFGDEAVHASVDPEAVRESDGTAVAGEPAGGASVDADEQVQLADEGTEES